ncbi:DsbA family oxidoreductase [Phenylobacterium sp.]|uniref:DsbA family oxidoreductase n=1 Tax=Phenylobacterium sp. TaxID=1871053 RepID=UPI0035ADD25A
MTKPMKIDFISDVVCPWCVIGLGGLEEALGRLDGVVDAKITFHPFELNPQMPAEGQDIAEHVFEKYGATPEQSAANRAAIQQRAADVGFTITYRPDSRIYNTFDAHRLLHWAGLQGRQLELKKALFQAYFTDGRNPGDHEVLVEAAGQAGLDPAAAREVLTSGKFAEHIRNTERQWYEAGVASVPTLIINDRYVITGGQPAELFEKALRRISEEA